MTSPYQGFFMNHSKYFAMETILKTQPGRKGISSNYYSDILQGEEMVENVDKNSELLLVWGLN